jgi:hypothetical protein
MDSGKSPYSDAGHRGTAHGHTTAYEAKPRSRLISMAIPLLLTIPSLMMVVLNIPVPPFMSFHLMVLVYHVLHHFAINCWLIIEFFLRFDCDSVLK